MNYYRKGADSHIETEVACAQAYGRGLTNIYELQLHGEHGLQPLNSYQAWAWFQ